MANRSHFNSAHRSLNRLRKEGRQHSSFRETGQVVESCHRVVQSDCLKLLGTLESATVQLIVCDPPYNLDIASWDSHEDYAQWAREWLDESYRVLRDSGSLVIFGGFQFQSETGGDLLELMHHLRHRTPFRLVNLIVWHYRNGMSAHRFFANRHEEIAWFAKTGKYTFNLDAVRIPYDEATKKTYLRDKRLNPKTVELGKNPTNVWEIPRLNGNSRERLGHPTQKPLPVIRRLVQALSNPGDLVLDFFAGSATTMRACIEEGRHILNGDQDPLVNRYAQTQMQRVPPSTLPFKVELPSSEQPL